MVGERGRAACQPGFSDLAGGGNQRPQGAFFCAIGPEKNARAEASLRRAFREELRDGHAQIVSAISSVVVRSALGGNIQAARYWLATHGGPEWRVTEGRVIIDPELAKLAEDRRRTQAMTVEEIAAEIAELDRKIALAENPPAKPNGAGSAH